MRNLENLKVKDVYKTISKKPTTVPVDAHLDEVVKAIIDDPVTRSVYVVDENMRFVGFITVLQLLRLTEIKAGGDIPGRDETMKILRMETSLRIDEVMHHPIFVYENYLLLKILKNMVDEKVQELPVVNSERKIIGDLNCLEILKGFWKL